MVIYVTKNRIACTLGKELGRGGEGIVYEVAERSDLAAKIYDLASPDREQKLSRMCSNPPSDPNALANHAAIAWPVDVLYDSTGNFVGFIMPKVLNSVELLKIIIPMLRDAILPGFSERYLYHSARNLASSVGALHKSGYVIGDLNSHNVRVNNAALVTLIDCDSFQVVVEAGSERKVYRCPVGTPEYTPPELQGMRLKDVDRKPEHDCFALAVLIFQLLMEGVHPYQGVGPVNDEYGGLGKKISDGHFPHSSTANPLIAPPPGSYLLTSLPPEIETLMRRCFEVGYRVPLMRPSAYEWWQALGRAEALVAQPGWRRPQFHAPSLLREPVFTPPPQRPPQTSPAQMPPIQSPIQPSPSTPEQRHPVSGFVIWSVAGLVVGLLLAYAMHSDYVLLLSLIAGIIIGWRTNTKR